VLEGIPVDGRTLVPAILVIIMVERRYQAFKIKQTLKALDAFEKETGNS
jgi:hypothetical protein